ncbi:MAG TPA: heme o synthase, partial [Chloroflexota bacterium]|nr:heme o synthase [Chloroflexota bacterium]
RSPVSEAQAGLVEPLLSGARPRGIVAWLATLSAVGSALALIAEGSARSAPAVAWLSTAALAVDALAALLALSACGAMWLARRDDAGPLLAVTLAVVVLPVRAVSAAVLLSLDMAILAEITSLGLGFLGLGCLVWAAAASLLAPTLARAGTAQAELFRRVAEVTALIVFGVGISGVTVRAVGASWACGGVFPDCNGLGALPLGREPLADLQLYHRLLAYVALALVVWLAIEAFRTQGARLGRASLMLLGATLVEGAIGAVSVSLSNPPFAQALHTAGATAGWSAAVFLVALSHRLGVVVRAPVASSPPVATSPTVNRAHTRTVLAYVQLTKPRVMSLLLATTAAAMIIAARGLPDLGVFLATLVGGALMSGGAGAINHYVDRDIDPLMGRTAWRPIPSGIISPRAALWFGIGLAVLASEVFIAFVNVLACLLALVGLLGYVFIYTLWLKRSTPSNIVIGGAAGAIPPLVGWAAVTNEISSLTAWYLFAIIFFWTPPHFWALSLLIRKHYERAGVPMLPVVRGEDETRRQIVLYSLLLVVLTLVLSPFGMMGVVYFGAATVLGGLFIRDALRLWRRATPQAARRLYLYSILYLFALFAAMAVDRVISSL